MSDNLIKKDLDLERELRHWNSTPGWERHLICFVVAQVCQSITRVANRLRFTGLERWKGVLRSRDRGLLSFSNHVSMFDDPLLIASLTRPAYKGLRWIGADHRNFFSTRVKGILFSGGKCVPIVRGGGLEQPGFHFLEERLAAGDWVHIFPEGGRTREPGARLRTPFKLGIGRLLAEARPIAMPFYHFGMHRILPVGSVVPRLGKKIQVTFGEPTVVDEAWLANLSVSQGHDLWQAVTDWSYEQLFALEQETHPEAI